MSKFPPMPPPHKKARMVACMQSNVYGENTGKGYTGVKISVCRECEAKYFCDRENWIALGGRP